MQQALMELLGFGDSPGIDGRVVCKEGRSCWSARDIRAIATASDVAACASLVSYGAETVSTRSRPPPPQQQQFGGSAMRSAPKKQSQRRQKQLRKPPRGRAKGVDEGADYLAALGFDENVAQERALGLSQPPQKKHAAFWMRPKEYKRAVGIAAGAENSTATTRGGRIPPPRALPPPARRVVLGRFCLPAGAPLLPGHADAERLQSAVYPCAFSSRKNMLVSGADGRREDTNVALAGGAGARCQSTSSERRRLLAQLANHKACMLPLKAFGARGRLQVF